MVRYIRDPVAFVHQVLNADPDRWQVEALQLLADEGRVAIRAGHGVGKSTLEAWAVLWFMFTRPFPKVPCTAPTARQLFDVLWPEINKWMSRSPVLKKYFEWQKTRVVMVQEPERWFASARSAAKPENLAGIHEDHVLFIVDEASGVKDEIFETIEGALTTPDAKLVICGNPTRTSGVFYDAFHKDRDKYATMKVSCLDSPRVTPDYAERLKRKYGEDSDVYRVRVLGEFPKAEPDVFIPLEAVEAATMRDVCDFDDRWEPILIGQPITIGVDVAYFGSDETVIYYRVGAYVFDPIVRHQQDTTATAADVVRLARQLMEHYRRPDVRINIDIGAMGPGVLDQVVHGSKGLHGRWNVVPIAFGGAGDLEHHDMATVLWSHAREKLPEVRLPNDERTVAQLSTRKYKVDIKGRLQIESKDDYKKRYPEDGSPDRADALVLCLYDGGVDAVHAVQTTSVRPATAGIRRKTF
ncbi:MAG: phage terminase large subunit [Alicyclobacillus sp.]|nr:phage terminase large subunit [Alicyclobacillus sp.]